MGLGVSSQQLAADRAARQQAGAADAQVLGVAPQLWPAVRLFGALCRTQWLWVAGGRGVPQRVGLRYEVVPVVARMLGLRLRPQLLDQLQVLEAEGLRVLNAAVPGAAA